MISPSVERHHLNSFIDPSEGISGVCFSPNLSAHVNKASDPPEFIRQLTLEVISNIPDDAFLIYTDVSRNKHTRSESGIYIKSQNYSSHTKLRNSDGCSVLRNELIAIDTGLKEALSIPGANSIWILSDTRNAIQHLSNWHKHASIAGNEIADALGKDGTAQPNMNSALFTYSELHSSYINKKISTVPPAHHWYEAKRPGGSLSLQCSRQEQTILTRFRSGHLRTLTFKDGNTVFPICVRCSACKASPAYILVCVCVCAWGFQNKTL
ncbi:gag-pol [Trichonephila clavipes]|uniref:Gag-pol n=1 Tax=Trichonephila clavipes TaxID=2585209 RepID=A0A8X6RP38_TRICX|nr:gag-pol [Trichonephila clavipes]